MTKAARAQPDRETALYQPVKQFLQSVGYEVKGEIAGCHLVGGKDGGEVLEKRTS